VAPQLRTWRDATGQFQVEAEFIGLEDGMVALRRSDGQVIRVPFDRLNSEDQQWVSARPDE
jgi:actin cytoskeleton-regulatory complex protein SLA1